MDTYDLVCDEGITTLRLMHRGPTDSACPIESLVVRVTCTDCVAELTVDSKSWSNFAHLFTPIANDAPWSKAWVSDAGEWKVFVERDAQGKHTIVSELDSLLDYHRWKLTTSFYMSGEKLEETGRAIREFIGQT